MNFIHVFEKLKHNNNKPIEQELKMNYREFFPRLLQHVPLKYFRIVRYYGSYSNRAKIPEEYLYKETQTKEQKVQPQESWEELQIAKTGINPLICANCQKRKTYLYTKLKSRSENIAVIFKRIILSKNEFRKQGAA